MRFLINVLASAGSTACNPRAELPPFLPLAPPQ